MHTKGEWKVVPATRSYVVEAGGWYDVAVVRDVGNEDNLANANLIAAAPALLEALEKSRRFVEAFVEDDIVAGRLILEIDAAIAAAKGE